MLGRFWDWYERTYVLNIAIALLLFLLQVLHLAWLFGEIVWFRWSGAPLFVLSGWHEWFIILVDFTEIPALVSVSLVYLYELKRRFSAPDLLYLGFLNIQWVHLFWITDEIVVAAFAGGAPISIPAYLAWIAIGIDYLEVPVMIDIAGKLVAAVRRGRFAEFLKGEFREV